MSEIADKINIILKSIPEKVKLVAVSKTKPIENILEAYNSGYKIFGENKVQELVEKYNVLPKDIEWHMIGHLQTNKVKYIVPFVSLIHAIDSEKLINEINKESLKINKVTNCLLQIKIAKEDTKFGLSIENAIEIIKNKEKYKNVNICGLMGMATYTDDKNQISEEFNLLNSTFIEISEKYFKNEPYFKEISMGMSGDYKIAIENGSTIIRVGSSIFGNRNYQN